MSLSFKKTLIGAAGILSLLAQGILLLPASLGSLLQNFIPWGSVTIGATFFVFSMSLFTIIISRQFAKKRLEWRANSILLLTQALTAIGVYLLLEGFAPREREAGFLLSSLVTALTTYGIITHTIHLEDSHPQFVEEKKDLPSELLFDTDTNVNAL